MKKGDAYYRELKYIKRNGYFNCTNRQLRDALYDDLKKEIPTLYKWEDKTFYYLNVIKKEDIENIIQLIKFREKLQQDIQEVDFILNHVGVDIESFKC